MNTPIVHVIDDDAGVRQATARLLSAARFTVQTHQNGADFLAAAGRGSAGCIILDVRMPGGTGARSPHFLREFPPNAPNGPRSGAMAGVALHVLWLRADSELSPLHGVRICED